MKELDNKTFSLEYNTRLPGFVNGKPTYLVSLDGKIRQARQSCPTCGHAVYVDNGYHVVQDSMISSLGLTIKIAQFCCKRCGSFWSSHRDLIDSFIKKEKEFVKSLMLGCVRSGLSLERASSTVGEITGVNYSPQYVYELYVSALEQVKNERAASASGVYYYDEQYILENGKEACRLTVRDQVTGKILHDKKDVDAQEAAIMCALHEALDGLPVEAFTIDMARGYPAIIAKLYPNARIQWCIFHLYKLIWKELTDECGKNPALIQLYNAYSLFNIFFDHSIALKKLEELLARFQRWRAGDQKSDLEIEKGLREEFRSFVKSQKKQRRREGTNVPRRTLQESTQIFEEIKQQAALFPKILQKRIRRIDEYWDRFTLFQRDLRVQPTNNGMEQYFAATLAKTNKKDFRSANAVIRELRACQAEWNGQRLFSTTTLAEVLSLAGMLFLAFPPG